MLHRRHVARDIQNLIKRFSGKELNEIESSVALQSQLAMIKLQKLIAVFDREGYVKDEAELDIIKEYLIDFANAISNTEAALANTTAKLVCTALDKQFSSFLQALEYKKRESISYFQVESGAEFSKEESQKKIKDHIHQELLSRDGLLNLLACLPGGEWKTFADKITKEEFNKLILNGNEKIEKCLEEDISNLTSERLAATLFCLFELYYKNRETGADYTTNGSRFASIFVQVWSKQKKLDGADDVMQHLAKQGIDGFSKFSDPSHKNYGVLNHPNNDLTKIINYSRDMIDKHMKLNNRMVLNA